MSKYTESFEDWFDTEFETKPASYKLSRYTPTWKTWNHQQSKINELLERLRECEESLGFYADEWTTWCPISNGARIMQDDVEITENNRPSGGKRARAYFKNYEGKQ